MQAHSLPLPEQLQEEGKWFIVEQSRAICTQTGGDWKSYPHISDGAKQWREHMRPSVEKLSALLEGLGIYLQCPFVGCNMQGSYVDHITSTNGSHFKNLYQRNIPCGDGVPIAHLRETAWEQISIRGGAVRFNHLDWEVQMWRGIPPQSPGVPGSNQAQSFAAIGNAPFLWTGEQTHSEEVVRRPPSMGTGLVKLEDLQVEDEWVVVMESASVPVSQTGGWQAIPHIAGGKRHWSESMRGHAAKVARILQAHGLSFLDCSLCPTGRGWEEHIPGPKHYDKINELLGDNLSICDVRERLWQKWNIQQNQVAGSVRFNHLDGEIQMRKIGRGARQSVESSSGSPFGQCHSIPMPTLVQQVSPVTVQTPASTTLASQVLPIQLAPSNMSPSQSAQSSSVATTPSSACHLAKCMWRQRLPNVVSRLRRYVAAVGFEEHELTCQLCRQVRMSAGLEAHLGSDDHIDNLARTMSFLENPGFPEGKNGEAGLRVQKIEGRSGHIWFNHITGECGLILSLEHLDVREQVGGEWHLCDYQDHGRFWYNQDTHHYFEVKGDKGYDQGLWRHCETNLGHLPALAVANTEGPRTARTRVW
eukprot:TRINITY_DN102923_c0_g1_i1.p1 TRINITY_DN102923_c0_g1~~TRINITY_DN102923_c0_g1_i1.p1  ORF type:complete len:588 (+),score=52.26 TRINITY_DN102923_c0_g1_i1:134-1897(+)